jgi:two-component system, sensor histidine kinase and response regulator
VLCIDDDRDTLDVRQRVLRTAGYHVLTAEDGASALQMMDGEAAVDVVVLDYMMPGMNGDELAKHLKSEFPLVPIVAVSAVRLPAEMAETVDAYVQKGQDVELLLSTIARLISAPETPGNGESGRKTVLCADDEINELAARRMVFESAGFEVLEARNGAQALEVFQTKPVSAVVLDYFMPGMTGLSVAREMKRHRPAVPIVVLSGFTSLPGETIGLVDAWLQKRDVEALVREVEKLIARTVSRQSAQQ